MVERARRPKKLPVALTKEEATAVTGHRGSLQAHPATQARHLLAQPLVIQEALRSLASVPYFGSVCCVTAIRAGKSVRSDKGESGICRSVG